MCRLNKADRLAAIAGCNTRGRPTERMLWRDKNVDRVKNPNGLSSRHSVDMARVAMKKRMVVSYIVSSAWERGGHPFVTSLIDMHRVDVRDGNLTSKPKNDAYLTRRVRVRVKIFTHTQSEI